jgi:hypothetical protein
VAAAAAVVAANLATLDLDYDNRHNPAVCSVAAAAAAAAGSRDLVDRHIRPLGCTPPVPADMTRMLSGAEG